MSDERAAAIAGIIRQRLPYWKKTDLITPDVERESSPCNIVPVYSLARLVELAVAAAPRHQGYRPRTSGASLTT